MVCLDNSAYYVNLVVYANFAIWAFFFLPQYSPVTHLIASLNFSVLAYCAFAAYLPNYVPESTAATLALDGVFSVLFYLMIEAAGSIFFVVLGLLVFGPLTIVAREHIQSWFQHQFHTQLSDFTLFTIAAILIVMIVFIYGWMHHNDYFRSIGISIIYSILAAIGLRVLWIEYERLPTPYTDPLCCGEDYPDEYCPFIFKISFIVWLILLSAIRIVTIFMFNNYYKARKQRKHYNKTHKTIEIQTSTVDEASDIEPLIDRTESPIRLPRRWDRFY